VTVQELLTRLRTGRLDRRFRWAGGGLLAVGGTLLLVGQTVLSTQTLDGPGRVVAGLFFPTLFCLTLVVSAVFLATQSIGRFLPLIAVWSVGAAVVLVALEQIVVLYRRLLGLPTELSSFFLLFFTSGGAVVGLFLGVYDARLRQTRQQLDEERDRAQQFSERLTVLNRVLRHDLRSGVQSIRGYAGMLPDPDHEEMTAEEPIQRIESRAQDLYEMAESAREVQELVAGGAPRIETRDLARTTRQVVEKAETRYDGADIAMSSPDTARAQVHPAVQTAIEELIENAIQHNDSPDPRVRVECTVAAETVTVAVTDNGSGIPEAERKVVTDGDETPLEHASGVGLWVVRWIVDAADGTLRFDTEDPDGSRVAVRFDRGR
jgi:signal transduction histidine kinase